MNAYHGCASDRRVMMIAVAIGIGIERIRKGLDSDSDPDTDTDPERIEKCCTAPTRLACRYFGHSMILGKSRSIQRLHLGRCLLRFMNA